MSRRVGRRVEVITGADAALGVAPVALCWEGRRVPVLRVRDCWREWIGILEGEPERDVWRIEVPAGLCELHRLPGRSFQLDAAPGDDGIWILARWED